MTAGLVADGALPMLTEVRGAVGLVAQIAARGIWAMASGLAGAARADDHMGVGDVRGPARRQQPADARGVHPVEAGHIGGRLADQSGGRDELAPRLSREGHGCADPGKSYALGGIRTAGVPSVYLKPVSSADLKRIS